MKLIRKRTFFRRPEIEMSKEEYEVYKLGRFYGIVDGMIYGIGLFLVIMLLSKLFVL